MIINPVLKKLAKKQKAKSYVAECQGAEFDIPALGILISQGVDWNVLDILKIAYEALEDSNAHADCEVIQTLIDQYE